MPSIHGRAFAKINLGLRILDRRPDGFHELRTVFQTISLADRIRVDWRRARSTRIEVDCNELALAGSDNLAWRAADALLSMMRVRGQVYIRIEKNIPSGAGLGGGSSDAGATLLALSRLLDPPPAREELLSVAAGLGSDVPFFLTGGRAVGIGRGEEVYPIPETLRQWFVLATPSVHVSTPVAYRDLAAARPALTLDRKGFILNVFCAGLGTLNDADANQPLGALKNDFEGPIFRKFPELRQIKRKLVRAGAKQALMSGSGSSLFGVFGDRPAAVRARETLAAEGLAVQVVRSVARAEFARTWKQAERKK